MAEAMVGPVPQTPEVLGVGAKVSEEEEEATAVEASLPSIGPAEEEVLT